MSWQNVLGHDRIRQSFEQIVQRGRLGHAYLFVGPPGIGKRLFAQELARALLCEKREKATAPLEACDSCFSCRLMQAGTHPDFFAVARPEESNEFPVEVMRELCGNFMLKSARGHGKIALVDDADDLNDASANCFLKTLEEPPPGSLFLLLGTSKQQQLATILSRCQLVRFVPLPAALVRQVLQEQGISDPVLLERAVLLSGGSPGVALGLADPGLWEFRRQCLRSLAQQPFNPVQTSGEWLAYIEEAGKEGALQRRRASSLLRLLVELLRDVLALLLGASPRSTDAQDQEPLERLCRRLTDETALELIERCLQAEEQAGRYLQLALVIEGLLDSFAQRLNAPG